LQAHSTSSNPFGPSSASSNGNGGFEGSAFGHHQNGFRSQEVGNQATGTTLSTLPALAIFNAPASAITESLPDVIDQCASSPFG